MFKDLPAKLVAAVAEINQKSRQSFAAEQQEIATKKAASAKMHTFMPKQPEPKADPAAVQKAAKMAEEAEGSIPKTPREKELAAKSGNKKRITFGDVLKARGVQKEEIEQADEAAMGHAGKVTMKHVMKSNASPQVKAAIKKAAPDIKSYADRAAALNAAGIKREEVEPQQESWDDMLKAAAARRAAQGTGKFDKKELAPGRTVYTRKSSTFDDGGKDSDMKKADKKAKNESVEALDEGKMDKMSLSSLWHRHASHSYGSDQGYGIGSGSMKNNEHAAVSIENHVRKHYGNKVADDMVHHSDHHVAHAEYAGADAAKEHEEAAEKLRKKHGITGSLYGGASTTRSIKENMDTPGNSTHQCAIHVKSEQYGEGRTLTTQHAEPDADGYIEWYDVMFAEGIKRVLTAEVEILESEMHGHASKKKKKIAEAAETKVHPDAIHVSDAGGGKYKVHAVGKNFAHGVKVGEHLTDTHLDDFSEMGGKVKMVKHPK